MRRCRTCGEPKPLADYPTHLARRCSACHAAAVADSWCRVCRVDLPLGPKSAARRVCDRASCVETSRLRSAAKGRRASVRARARRKSSRKRCPACAERKPRTLEHFYVKARKPDGTVRDLDHVCKPCRRAEVRARYHSDADRRAKALATAKRQRARVLRRIEEDPDFAREWRERRQRYEDDRRRRAAEAEPPSAPSQGDRGGPKLPGKPLAALVDREASFLAGGLDALCDRLGITARRVHDWRDGLRVEFTSADRVLTDLGALWFDVWDPDAFPEVAQAFDADAVAA